MATKRKLSEIDSSDIQNPAKRQKTSINSNGHRMGNITERKWTAMEIYCIMDLVIHPDCCKFYLDNSELEASKFLLTQDWIEIAHWMTSYFGNSSPYWFKTNIKPKIPYNSQEIKKCATNIITKHNDGKLPNTYQDYLAISQKARQIYNQNAIKVLDDNYIMLNNINKMKSINNNDNNNKLTPTPIKSKIKIENNFPMLTIPTKLPIPFKPSLIAINNANKNNNPKTPPNVNSFNNKQQKQQIQQKPLKQPTIKSDIKANTKSVTKLTPKNPMTKTVHKSVSQPMPKSMSKSPSKPIPKGITKLTPKNPITTTTNKQQLQQQQITKQQLLKQQMSKQQMSKQQISKQQISKQQISKQQQMLKKQQLSKQSSSHKNIDEQKKCHSHLMSVLEKLSQYNDTTRKTMLKKLDDKYNAKLEAARSSIKDAKQLKVNFLFVFIFNILSLHPIYINLILCTKTKIARGAKDT